MMMSRILLFVVCAGLAITVQLSGGTFTTFEVPGSSLTVPLSINDQGAITGFYSDANNVQYCFLRTPDGVFTTFGGVPGQDQSVSINPELAVTGFYAKGLDPGPHGFLRAADGTLTQINVPGAIFGTFPQSINPAGAIAGFYNDRNNVSYGFLRNPNGAFTTFSAQAPPHAFAGMNDTIAASINPGGTIAGFFYDAGGFTHGFIRASDGTFTRFDAPGAIHGTFPEAINPSGATAGSYSDNQGVHGFQRSPDGAISRFDAPGAGTGLDQGTRSYSINPEGSITGFYIDANYVYHWFVRAPDGTLITFDAPNAVTVSHEGTFPASINAPGTITGYYYDTRLTARGFLLTP